MSFMIRCEERGYIRRNIVEAHKEQGRQPYLAGEYDPDDRHVVVVSELRAGHWQSDRHIDVVAYRDSQ